MIISGDSMKSDPALLNEVFKAPATSETSPHAMPGTVIMDVFALHTKQSWSLDEAERMGRAATAVLASDDPHMKFISMGGEGAGDILNEKGDTPVRISIRTQDPQKVLQTLSEIFSHDGQAMFLGITNQGDLLLPKGEKPIPKGIEISLDGHEKLHTLLRDAANESKGTSAPEDKPVTSAPTTPRNTGNPKP